MNDEERKAKADELAETIKLKMADRLENADENERPALERHIGNMTKLAQQFLFIKDSNNKVKGSHLPPIHFMFRLNLYTFVVTYRNEGKMSATCELIAFTPNPDIMPMTPDKSQEVLILTTGEVMTRMEFEKYKRRRWPLEHEAGRNPENVTLGVQDGVLGSKGGL